jgi:hypothetical protein
VGCGRSPVAVSGSALLDGKTLGNANLGFVPLNEAGRHAVATTDEDGEFAVQPGLLPGEYKVTVVANPAPFDVRAPKAKPIKNPIPPKYGNPSTTPLRLNIPSEATARLELTSQP